MLNITDVETERKLLPILRLGFRPFFLMGSFFALLSMFVWLLALNGNVTPSPFNGILWWHSHEMLFGFTTAIIAGFLLTAVQTWTSIPGLRGYKLCLLFLLWGSARVFIFLNPPVTPIVIMLIDLAFLPMTALLLGLPLMKIRQYRNMLFIPILLFMTLSNVLTYLPQFGYSTALVNQGLHSMVLLVTLLIAILGGRVVPMFTANGTGTTKVLPLKWLEVSSLASLFLLYLGILSGGVIHSKLLFGSIAFISAGLHLYRWLRWRFWVTLGTPLVWSLHFSMVFIPLGLAMFGVSLLTDLIGLSVAIHCLTVGAIGGMIIAMMSRVSLGHTGRALQVGLLMQFVFVSIIFSAITRTFLVLLQPEYFSSLWLISGLLWCAAFTGFLWVYFPVLTKPRIDGRPG